MLTTRPQWGGKNAPNGARHPSARPGSRPDGVPAGALHGPGIRHLPARNLVNAPDPPDHADQSFSPAAIIPPSCCCCGRKTILAPSGEKWNRKRNDTAMRQRAAPATRGFGGQSPPGPMGGWAGGAGAAAADPCHHPSLGAARLGFGRQNSGASPSGSFHSCHLFQRPEKRHSSPTPPRNTRNQESGRQEIFKGRSLQIHAGRLATRVVRVDIAKCNSALRPHKREWHGEIIGGESEIGILAGMRPARKPREPPAHAKGAADNRGPKSRCRTPRARQSKRSGRDRDNDVTAAMLRCRSAPSPTMQHRGAARRQGSDARRLVPAAGVVVAPAIRNPQTRTAGRIPGPGRSPETRCTASPCARSDATASQPPGAGGLAQLIAPRARALPNLAYQCCGPCRRSTPAAPCRRPRRPRRMRARREAPSMGAYARHLASMRSHRRVDPLGNWRHPPPPKRGQTGEGVRRRPRQRPRRGPAPVPS